MHTVGKVSCCRHFMPQPFSWRMGNLRWNYKKNDQGVKEVGCSDDLQESIITHSRSHTFKAFGDMKNTTAQGPEDCLTWKRWKMSANAGCPMWMLKLLLQQGWTTATDFYWSHKIFWLLSKSLREPRRIWWTSWSDLSGLFVPEEV